MTFSEHTTNLLLIIIGVGMTELIIGSARLLKEYDRIRFYLPSINIIVFFFLYYLLTFFDSYFLLVNVKHVSLWDIVAVGYPPFAAIYTSYFIFPRIPDEGTIDLESNYHKYHKIGISLGLSITFFRLIRNVFYYHESPLVLKNAVEALIIPMFILGFLLKGDFNQKFGTSILLVVMLIIIYVNSLSW